MNRNSETDQGVLNELMNRIKHFVAAATVSAGLLIQAAIIPTTILRPSTASPPAPAATTTAMAAPVAAAPEQNTAPAPATAPVPKPTGKVIYIDAGHGGRDAGAVHEDANGRVDLTEKEVNLAIALKLADMLRQEGYTVRMARTDDTTPGGSTAADLQARVDQANKAGADLFVSIHNDSSANRSVRGTSVYYCSDRPFSADSQRLATLVNNALTANLQKAGYNAPNHGVKDDEAMGHFAVLAPANLDRASKMPGILGESLYMSNDQDAAQLRKPEVQEAIARGYFEGIHTYFGNGQS